MGYKKKKLTPLLGPARSRYSRVCLPSCVRFCFRVLVAVVDGTCMYTCAALHAVHFCTGGLAYLEPHPLSTDRSIENKMAVSSAVKPFFLVFPDDVCVLRYPPHHMHVILAPPILLAFCCRVESLSISLQCKTFPSLDESRKRARDPSINFGHGQ